MKVYIFTDYGNVFVLETLKNLLSSHGHQVEVVKSMHHLNPDSNVIISTNVSTQSQIFQRYWGGHNIYGMIDNKIQFYQYIVRNAYLCYDNNVHLIPSYDKGYTGPNITKQYMVKAANGFSGKFNQVKHASIYSLIQQYGNTHQIEDLLSVKHIYGVSVCCKLGKIIGAYSYLTNGPITSTSFHADRTTNIRFPEVKGFMKAMVANLNLNGIIEVEFLIDHSNKIFVMECNPRISGSVRVPHYYNSIIEPYLRTFCDKTVNEINL